MQTRSGNATRYAYPGRCTGRHIRPRGRRTAVCFPAVALPRATPAPAPTPPRSGRFDWEAGSSRVAIGFTARGDTRSTVADGHERLPDAETAAAMKALWREGLAELQQVLED
jgi:hypothetical protein